MAHWKSQNLLLLLCNSTIFNPFFQEQKNPSQFVAVLSFPITAIPERKQPETWQKTMEELRWFIHGLLPGLSAPASCTLLPRYWILVNRFYEIVALMNVSVCLSVSLSLSFFYSKYIHFQTRIMSCFALFWVPFQICFHSFHLLCSFFLLLWCFWLFW